MKRTAIKVVLALSLVAAGWAAGKAQTPAPEFTIAIDAPIGRTTIRGVRGCMPAMEAGITDHVWSI